MIPCHPNQNGNYEEYKQEQVLAKMWGNKVHSYIAGGAANQCSHSGKVWRFLRKHGIEQPFDPSIPLLGLHQKNLKSAYYRNAATSMFITTKFTIASLWNQTTCPSIDKWIKKIWYIYTIEYCSAIKIIKLCHLQANG